jgi:hypothetical protein
MKEIHVGDIGTVFTLEIYETIDGEKTALDISTATAMKIRFYRADKTSFERDLEVTNDGKDGLVEYITVDGDLAVDGDWKLQGVITLPTGTWHTEQKKFKVYPNILV